MVNVAVRKVTTGLYSLKLGHCIKSSRHLQHLTFCTVQQLSPTNVVYWSIYNSAVLAVPSLQTDENL